MVQEIRHELFKNFEYSLRCVIFSVYVSGLTGQHDNLERR